MKVSEFLLIRTPLISIERLLKRLEQNTLTGLLQEDLVKEALQVASPNFYGQLKLNPALTTAKLQETALKYLLRMGSRCTPFGLFAGCTMGFTAKKTKIDFSNRQIRCHYRLDMQVLTAIASHISRHATWQKNVRFWPNSGIYQIGSQLRYTEEIQVGSRTRHCITQIDASPAILQVLEFAINGATIQELTHRLNQPRQDPEEAQTFISQLIEDQILISELAPSVTGPDFLETLIERISDWPDCNELILSLQQIHGILHDSSVSHDKGEAIRELLKNIFGGPLPYKDIVQCDSFFETENKHISQTVVKKLQDTLCRLNGIDMFSAARHTNLEVFKEQFYARYEEREIPLAEVLDEEMGIGYGQGGESTGSDSLIDDLFSPIDRPSPSVFDDMSHQLLLRHYTDWLERGTGHVELTDSDLDALKKSSATRASNYYALGYFLASSAEALDQGHHQFVLKGMGGPSAFNLMGRFCNGDPQLAERIIAQNNQLQKYDSDRIYAEIAHLPSPRAGNVLQRPHLRAYEIPYLTRSTLPVSQQVPLSDLLISVPKSKRIVLRSKRLNKEIVPCLTTAHAYGTGLPLYRFLGDLQQQDESVATSWQWGPLAKARRLPRVVFHQIILQEAQWQLKATDLDAILSDHDNVSVWRSRWKIPNLVAIVEGDNELLLDLSTVTCRQLLVSHLRRLQRLTLIEWLRTPDNCWINGPDGKLTHEIVIPFISPQSKPALPERVPINIQRSFIPGSEWLYLKIYCGPQTATHLVQVLGATASRMLLEKKISHWFFVRYYDPDHHLRIRLHINDVSFSQLLLETCREIIQPLVVSGEVNNVQVDTYWRELERYSIALMESTEWLFWADSHAVFQIHQVLPSNESLFAAGVLGIDAYLTDYKFNVTEKAAICCQHFTSLLEDYKGDANLQHMLNKKFRVNQETVERLLKAEGLSDQETNWKRLFKQRGHCSESHLKRVLSSPEQPVGYLNSLIHLFVNRLFSCQQRVYELLLYHHLYKAYQSLSVRLLNQTK